MRYRRTPCLSKKELEELEEEMRMHPENREELRLSNPRAVYKLIDEDGSVIAVFDPEKDTTMDVTVDVKRRITQVMHDIDDAEQRQNNKERRLEPYMQKRYEEDMERFADKFFERNGRKPRWDELPEGGHRSYVYLDAPLGSDADETVGDVIADSRVTYFSEEETPVSVMDEIIMSDLFDDRERTIYEGKIHKRLLDREIGEELGCTGQYVGQIWKKMEKKIKNLPEIQKFFRV